MLLHNLKIAWRNLMKYRLQTTISILSLAVGMVCFSLSALWLHYEKSYDNFWPDAENICLLKYQRINGDSPYLPYPLAEELAKYPEIEQCIRLQGSAVQIEGFDTSPSLCVDSAFADFSGVRVLSGDSRLQLGPYDVALTESLAKKIFPNGNALGQELKGTINYNSEEAALTVKAIVEDCPKNSEWHYEMLSGIDTQQWDSYRMYAFNYLVRVQQGHMDQLTQKLSEVSFIGHVRYEGKDEQSEENFQFILVPLSELRETGYISHQQKVRLQHLRIFLLVSLIVIVCALFNYLSLLVTRIRMRQRELMLRYVFGSSKVRLAVLMATEIWIILSLSLVLGALCLSRVIDDFIQISNIPEQSSYFYLWYLTFSFASALVSILVVYAVIVWQSRQRLSSALDKRQQPSYSASSFRINLALQLTVSICAIFCSAVMMSQIHYLMTSPEMGFTKHNVIQFNVFPLGKDHKAPAPYGRVIYDKVMALPEVTEALFDYPYPIPGGYYVQITLCPEGREEMQVEMAHLDEDYYRFMGMQLLEGELPRRNHSPNGIEAVVTESLARILGDNIVGKTIKGKYYGTEYVITGIMRDLNYQLPTAPSVPILFTPIDKHEDSEYSHQILLKYADGTDYRALTSKIEELTRDIGDFDFSYTHAESAYEETLSSERILCNLLSLVTAVSILISVFGIFSTLSLALQRRRKEIALRKIHGAKVRDIFRLFLSEYVWLLLGAAVVAFPVGFYLMHQWLSQYTRQVPFAWWLCPAILLGMAALILLTVFWQIWRAAKANPAEVIKE